MDKNIHCCIISLLWSVLLKEERAHGDGSIVVCVV